MLTETALLSLARTAESQYLERKASRPKDAELRKTLCAFANSTPEGQYSVLFLGINDDGGIKGIDAGSVDSIQRDIAASARDDFYPPISLYTQVVTIEGKGVVAVIVEHSKNRPHFAGHAYRRVGATSQKADDFQYNEFVLERIDKVRHILRGKGKVVSVKWFDSGVAGSVGGKVPAYNDRDFMVVDCDAFVLHLRDVSSGLNIALPLEQVTISFDTGKSRTKFLAESPYPSNSPIGAVHKGLSSVIRNLAKEN